VRRPHTDLAYARFRPGSSSGVSEPGVRHQLAASNVQRRFERVLAFSRLLALIPVVFLLLDAAGSFIYGADILVRTADGDIGEPARIGGRLGIFLIVMDTFLVGATLMIAAFGFYELFVLRRQRAGHQYWLPTWLQMHDLEDLKARVTSMLILVASITFVDILVESHNEKGVLFLGLGIAGIVVALTAFLRFGRRDTRPGLDPEPATPDPGWTGTGSPAERTTEPDEEPAAPHRSRVIAIAAHAKLDLRQSAPRPASDAPPLTIRLVALLGQVSVLIPPDMHVTDSGLTLLGARSVTGPAPSTTPGPVLITKGATILGQVKIIRA